jgi:hypothetical protein
MTTPRAHPAETDPDFAGVTCPDCDSSEIELVSLFGGNTSEVLFSCTRCRSCFNWVKWEHRMPRLPARAGRITPAGSASPADEPR